MSDEDEIRAKLAEYGLPDNEQVIEIARVNRDERPADEADRARNRRQWSENIKAKARVFRAWTEFAEALKDLPQETHDEMREIMQTFNAYDQWHYSTNVLQSIFKIWSIGEFEVSRITETKHPRKRHRTAGRGIELIWPLYLALVESGAKRAPAARFLSWYLGRFFGIERSAASIEQTIRNRELKS